MLKGICLSEAQVYLVAWLEARPLEAGEEQ